MKREVILEAYKEVFEGECMGYNLLGLIAYGYSSTNYDIFLREEEVYIIDWRNKRLINWYKLSHIGRCLQIIGTEPTKEELVQLFKDIVKEARENQV